MKYISSFHYLTQEVPKKSHQELAEAACASGIRWVQLRLKNKKKPDMLSIAKEVKAICDHYSAVLIVNDHVELAAEAGAHGVHLGKEDMPIREARRILGSEMIIGGTVNTSEDLLRVAGEGADYAGIGPFRFTATKAKLSPILGLEGILKVMQTSGVTLPLIAIGGIKVEDVASILKIGVHGVAVSSAINLSYDVHYASKSFLAALRRREEELKKILAKNKS